MWNPFKFIKKVFLKTRWHFSVQRKNLVGLNKVCAILNELQKRGLLYWREKDKMLLIEQSLAMLQIAQGRRKFQNFLNQVAMWQNFLLIQRAQEDLRIKTETDAVREATKTHPSLSKEDIMRIRQEARAKMQIADPSKLDCVKEFDILVIRSSAISRDEATEENGQLLAVGHYDGEKVEMAMYDDVKYILQNHD